MIARYLDLKTGQRAEQQVTRYALTNGNYSCDCNRRLAFGITDDDADCCSERFIVYEVVFQEGIDPEDEAFDSDEIIRQANEEYWDHISKHPIRS